MKQLFNGGKDESAPDFIRIGEVTSINPAAHTARVTFDDDDGVTSAELPVIVPNTIANSDYAMPDIGQDALCVFLSTGKEQGFIIGSFYAGEVTPPASSADIRKVKFSDGTVIEYDRGAHKLTADVKGDIEITATGNISAHSDSNITLDATGNISLNAGGGLSIHAEGGTSCTGGGQFSIQAASIHLNEGGD